MIKSTHVKAYVKKTYIPDGDLYKSFQFENGCLLIGEYEEIKVAIEHYQGECVYLEVDYQNAIMDYPNYLDQDIRIEKGAIIREGVIIKNGAIILMNATINKDAIIGENTMIDMNAVVGSKAIVGANVHISAGVVLAGVLEPVSKAPVIIEDGVFIGANSVIFSGVRIGEKAVIGAGSVVTKDVKERTLVYGSPAEYIRDLKESDYEKTALNLNLR